MDSQCGCRLFALPAEIRNHIYDLSLTVLPTEPNSAVKITRTPPSSEKPTILSLLQTCRLINEEAHSIFYHNNTLQIARWEDLGFFREVSPQRLAAIRRLEVCIVQTEHMTRLFKLMRPLCCVQELVFIRTLQHGCRRYCRCPDYFGDDPSGAKTEQWHLKTALRKTPGSLVKITIRVAALSPVTDDAAVLTFMSGKFKLEADLNEVLKQRSGRSIA